MQKILIISNYFPPCNLTSSERIYSWALHFKQLGIYPIVITRNWNIDSTVTNNYYLPVGKEIEHHVHENYEVYNLPFEPNFNENYILKHTNRKYFKFFYPFTRLANILLENFTLRYNSFYSFYKLANQLIESNQIKKVLISAFPFYLFKIGDALKQRNHQIEWVADYRDDWNSNNLDSNANTFFKKIARIIESRSERKWLKSSIFFTTVSQVYADRISAFIKKKGHVVENGFLDENYNNLTDATFETKEFTMVYAGNVFHNQNFQILIDAVQNLIRQNFNFKVLFLGLDHLHPEYHRIRSYVWEDCKNSFEFSPRKTKAEALQILKNCNLLFTSAYGDLKGLPSSKLYDYIALRKPVLLCPSDNDYMHEALSSTGQLIYANTKIDCIRHLKNLYQDLMTNGEITSVMLDEKAVEKFSRFKSSQKMVELILKGTN